MAKKVRARDAKKLQRLLKVHPLHSALQREAWDVLKRDGLVAAEAFVQGNKPVPQPKKNAAPYQIWGVEQIDGKSISQMEVAVRLPIAVKGALMPDAHVGYGLPIGGVLATENAVIPYAVGVDIACRMRMSVFGLPEKAIHKHSNLLKDTLMQETRFGAGKTWSARERLPHPVLDLPDWEETRLLKELRPKAIEQLGTSGGGNHFVEWGIFSLEEADEAMGLEAGRYLALLSHSGSRGVGFKIAKVYTELAQSLNPHVPKDMKRLAWLEMTSAEGQEYWHSMQLAGQFASANHAIIHERMASATGFQVVASVENHHNFAWREQVDGNEVIVHRKGATPAGAGVMGIIPGSMGDSGFVVRGKGNEASINSASHGAGRKLSRRQAKDNLSRADMKQYLKRQDIELLGGGLDESPQAYKNIRRVMEAQTDLVDIVGEFAPRIVRMASD